MSEQGVKLEENDDGGKKKRKLLVPGMSVCMMDRHPWDALQGQRFCFNIVAQ